LEIAAKQLQLETWLGLLLTAYRKSLAPYPVVSSPTLYDLPFSHRALSYYSALWPFKVLQGHRFSCHLKGNMRLPISDQ